MNAREFAEQCRARAETFIAGLGATAEELDRGAQYLATANASFEAGNYAVTAYASAIRSPCSRRPRPQRFTPNASNRASCSSAF